ncbi:arginine--tRNA ligase [Stagnimonas aquatica]|uniref:Arginine--tRNA ligase n=1 Tax=Stagnimonas aquatica TaxID=2689987 RepID=A0A3N0VHB1_9GAMM|nr:arginine--tRNA ligase [Stagnimonas aquatica]ROH92084.1 arginine--tRNA ligase [Stagnimonas aquatica]
MKPHLQDLLRAALNAACAELGAAAPAANIVIDATKDKVHGDFASNLAMVCAKGLGQPPRKFAEALVRHLPASPRVAKVEIAGPGFINFFLTGDALSALLPEILAAGETWGQDRSGAKGKVMVEFVSANPTGPMHVGHGRGAAYGDTLANLLAATGYAVHREYYINDAGRQVDVLTVSVWLRYLEAGGETLSFPKRGYPADYIRRSAESIRAAHGAAFQRPAADLYRDLAPEPQLPEGADDKTKDAIKLQQEAYLDRLIERARALLGGEGYAQITRAALDDQLAVIRATLAAFHVRFDQWYSERALVESGFAKTAIERLHTAGYVYEKDGAQWLKTSDYGDEKDRVLFKADGAATYFANDLAYHVDKLDRGYPLLVDVWGADHHGYIARVRAAIEMLTQRKDALHVALMQFVTLSSGRMGKRSGNFVTLQDLIDEVGADATRFFYLARSHDQHLEFDIDLARSQSNDNPVYYVQYAHARICSVFRQLAEKGGTYDRDAGLAALARLDTEEEKNLLTVLGKYPELLQIAAGNRTPHTLAFYVQDLAAALHAYYNQHKFLIDDAELQNARLVLIEATRTVLRGALGLLGVEPKDSM